MNGGVDSIISCAVRRLHYSCCVHATDAVMGSMLQHVYLILVTAKKRRFRA